MSDTVTFTGVAGMQGFGFDWTAIEYGPAFYGFAPNPYYGATNWSTPPLVLPYGMDLLVAMDSELAGQFTAGEVTLLDGTFQDLGELIATSVTIEGPATAEVSGQIMAQSVTIEGPARTDVLGQITALTGFTMNSQADLQILGSLTVLNGDFDGSDAVASTFDLQPGATMTVGNGGGGNLSYNATGGSFKVDGTLTVNGTVTLSDVGGHAISFLLANLVIDPSGIYGRTSVMDDPGGTITMSVSKVQVGPVNAPLPLPETLQFGKANDQTTIALQDATITGGSINNFGTVAASGEGQIGLSGSYLNDGATAVTEVADGSELSFQDGSTHTAIAAASQGVFKVDGSGKLDLADNTGVGGTVIQMVGRTATLAVNADIGTFGGEITGFSNTNTVEIEGGNVDGAEYDGQHTLRVSLSAGGYIDFTDIVIAGQAAGQVAYSNAGADGFVVACYCPGTLILTDRGEMPVEILAIGDTVVTASGTHRPIKWIGKRSYAGRFLAANPALQPVRFRAGSLGDGLPRRDLLVSPDHAMFLDGLLIPARCLLNGATIIRERGLDRVRYVHVELDSHDVLLAQGAPSESYLDDGSRGMFHNASEFAALYPKAGIPGAFCAPRVEQGAQLEAIRRRLAATARGLAAA